MEKTTRLLAEGLFATEEPPQLLGSRCQNCSTTFFPRRAHCGRCFEMDTVEQVSLSRHGTLHTFTVVHRGPPGIKGPYILGSVELPEGMRIVSQIVDCLPNNVRIGMELELTIGPVRKNPDGTVIRGYQYRPATEKPS